MGDASFGMFDSSDISDSTGRTRKTGDVRRDEFKSNVVSDQWQASRFQPHPDILGHGQRNEEAIQADDLVRQA